MTMLSKLLGKPQSLATKIGGVQLTDEQVARWFGGGRTSAAGPQVTEEKAMSLSAVFAGVNFLSLVMGHLPLSFFRRRADGGKEVALDDPAHVLLHTRPNRWMTALTFRRTLEICRLLWGNAYAEIQYDGMGRAAALWPLEPWRVKPELDAEQQLFFRVDGARRLEVEDIIHVPLISFDGVTGRSFIDFAFESLGLSITAQEYAARFFGSGARHGGLLEHPGTPPKETRQELRESWQRQHGGAENSSRLAVLWGGWKYTPDGGGVDPDDAQLLETRKFSTEEVARWLNVPPHVLRDLSRATFSNIEHQTIELVVYSFGPVFVAYEQEYDWKLGDPPTLFAKHNVAGLLRGDNAGRAEFYSKLINAGVLSINEAREKEDINPIGPAGDLHFVPMNMRPAEGSWQPEPDRPLAGESQGKPAGEDVQAQALNGAQVVSLLDIVNQVAAGQLPATSAKAMIAAAFPLITGTTIDAIIDPLEDFEPRQSEQPGPPQTPPPQSEGRDASMRALLTETLGRLIRVECNAVRRAAKSPGKFLIWLDESYPKHEARLAEALTPVLEALACQQTGAVVAHDLCRVSHAMLLEASGRLTPEEFAAGLGTLLEGWRGERASRIVTYLLGE